MQTRGDIIRGLDDEELSLFIASLIINYANQISQKLTGAKLAAQPDEVAAIYLPWLQEEVEDDT